jgi:hypothetical protein
MDGCRAATLTRTFCYRWQGASGRSGCTGPSPTPGRAGYRWTMPPAGAPRVASPDSTARRLGVERDRQSPDRGTHEGKWRRRSGSNRCIEVLQTSPLTTWVRRLGRLPVGNRRIESGQTGCPSRIRTSPNGSKVRCPTTRRRGRGRGPGGQPPERSAGRSGAEDGTRTRDPHLGKVMLYQLSHFRSKNRAGPICGAESQDRTGDTAIFSRVLYRLSYLGPLI